mmetsp:Transcript_40882/g.94935  ORF Transcript_40882/g.94935 Transcript_40882/m.94935 type:complete len:510 (-) Transcript_40882:24-1553(-)
MLSAVLTAEVVGDEGDDAGHGCLRWERTLVSMPLRQRQEVKERPNPAGVRAALPRTLRRRRAKRGLHGRHALQPVTDAKGPSGAINLGQQIGERLLAGREVGEQALQPLPDRLQVVCIKSCHVLGPPRPGRNPVPQSVGQHEAGVGKSSLWGGLQLILGPSRVGPNAIRHVTRWRACEGRTVVRFRDRRLHVLCGSSEVVRQQAAEVEQLCATLSMRQMARHCPRQLWTFVLYVWLDKALADQVGLHLGPGPPPQRKALLDDPVDQSLPPGPLRLHAVHLESRQGRPDFWILSVVEPLHCWVAPDLPLHTEIAVHLTIHTSQQQTRPCFPQRHCQPLPGGAKSLTVWAPVGIIFHQPNASCILQDFLMEQLAVTVHNRLFDELRILPGQTRNPWHRKGAHPRFGPRCAVDLRNLLGGLLHGAILRGRTPGNAFPFRDRAAAGGRLMPVSQALPLAVKDCKNAFLCRQRGGLVIVQPHAEGDRKREEREGNLSKEAHGGHPRATEQAQLV